MDSTNIKKTLNMVENNLNSKHCRFVARGIDKDIEYVSCYIVSDEVNTFFVIYTANGMDYILEMHVPCKKLTDATLKEAALYASKHVFKDSIRGHLSFEKNDFVFKTEIPIGEYAVSEDLFNRCFDVLLLELFMHIDNLRALSHGESVKDEMDPNQVLGMLLQELKKGTEKFDEECSDRFMTIPDGVIEDDSDENMETFDDFQKKIMMDIEIEDNVETSI